MLHVDTPLNGSVVGGGEYLNGTTSTINATPTPGWSFSAWTGDASGTVNPRTILMDANKAVGATFVMDTADNDGDGLSNHQEQAVYGTDPSNRDSDGDGLEDGYELGIGRYTIVTGTLSWEQARTDALVRNGQLATFSSQGEWNRALVALGDNALVPYDGLWIGASDAADEGDWAWVTGEPLSFTNWAVARPVTTTDNTNDYLEVSGGDGGEIGKWYDRAATTTRDGYILETGYDTSPTDADCDDDGLNDAAEIGSGSNPFLADTDGDSLSDGQEVLLTGTSPLLSDTGSTGIPDPLKDSDGDTLTNTAEINLHGTHPGKADTDGDGLRDDFELGIGRFALVSTRQTWAQAKTDALARSGHLATFTSQAEYDQMKAAIGSSALDPLDGVWVGASDEETDGSWKWITDEETGGFVIPWGAGRPSDTAGNTLDFAEIAGGEGPELWKWYDRASTSTRAAYILERGYPTNPLLADTDGDGLFDGLETAAGLIPTAADMDGDGWSDGAEWEFGGDPKNNDKEPGIIAKVSSITAGGDVVLRFPAAAGKTHAIHASGNLGQWQAIESGIIGEGKVIERRIPSTGHSKRFFKVEVQQ